MSRRLRTSVAAIFLIGLALWTWQLLEPRPLPEVQALLVGYGSLQFWLAKGLHLAGYCGLTLLALTLAAPAPRRLALAAGGMAAHGALTEYLQTLVPNRTGRWQDVLIDAAGVGLAALLHWAARRWLPWPFPAPHAPPPPGAGARRGEAAGDS